MKGKDYCCLSQKGRRLLKNFVALMTRKRKDSLPSWPSSTTNCLPVLLTDVYKFPTFTSELTKFYRTMIEANNFYVF